MTSINALAHVHRVTTRVGGRPCDVFVFDHHRSAFTVWAHAAQQVGGPLGLVTLDRHMDLEAPAAPAPELDAGLAVLDRYARESLAARNDDHILAAMDAGAVGDAVVIARSHEPASRAALSPYVDRAGRKHRCAISRSVDEAGDEAVALVHRADDLALDVDLDCFTTLCDAVPDEVLSWDVELIDAFLRPPDHERFWKPVLERTRVVTIAREPYHCGGLDRGAALWRAFSEVFFRRLLGVPAP